MMTKVISAIGFVLFLPGIIVILLGIIVILLGICLMIPAVFIICVMAWIFSVPLDDIYGKDKDDKDEDGKEEERLLEVQEKTDDWP